MPADEWLSDNQNALKWAVVDRVKSLGLVPEIFTNPRGDISLVAGKAWSAPLADDIFRRCVGAVLIGLPRWDFGGIKLPSEFCHYEGAQARTLGLPTLVLRQKDVIARVVFDHNFGPYVGTFDPTADATWLDTRQFTTAFGYWEGELRERRDVFLGYCGSSASLASEVKTLLTQNLGVTVLDWAEFTPGRTILEEIREAAGRCTGAVFLFTKDDEPKDPGPTGKAFPRDNVVFEAGYFSSLKTKHNVLIILEEGAKMPADLGGDIYSSLRSRSAVPSIKADLAKFIDAL
jgi:hypothetical protein